MIKKIQQLQSSCTSKLVADVKKAIPLKIKSQHTGIKIGRMILEIHSAIKNYTEVTEKAGFRVVHIFSIPFEPLVKAMQSAISNIWSQQYANQNSCFPNITNDQWNRKYLEDGYVPIDEAYQVCLGCAHWFVDEPNTNKTLQEKYLRDMREFEEKKKQQRALPRRQEKKQKEWHIQN